MISRAAKKLESLSGPNRYAAAWALGALGTLALPPLSIFPVFLISFPGLLFLLNGAQTKKQALFVGWMFGFGYFVLGLYWITFSLFVDFATWWWAIPFIVAGLPGYLAIYPALACLAYWLLNKKFALKGIAQALWFSVFWLIAAWLRGHLCSGFPWNMEGYTWTGVLPMLQSASLFGAYGLTLLTVFWACLPALHAQEKRNLYYGVGILSFALVLAFGVARLSTARVEYVPDIGVRIVQASIPQSMKWMASERTGHLRQHCQMSEMPSTIDRPITHIIWPETANTFILEENPGIAEQIATWLPQNSLLLTGGFRIAKSDPRKFYNTLSAIDSHGRVLGNFDKFHLVPWGEYIPYQEWLPLKSIAADFGEFVAGDGPYTIDGLPNTPAFSPLVCYEVIFPGAVKKPGTHPQWLVNITNDAWFGRTSGPHQHLAQALTRAVEEGVPLARAAGSGISVFVDPYGRILKKLPLGAVGIIDSPLPRTLKPTLFGRFGNAVFLLMTVFFGICAMLLTRRRA